MKNYQKRLNAMDQQRFEAATDKLFKGSLICQNISCLECGQKCVCTDPELVLERLAKWGEEEAK